MDLICFVNLLPKDLKLEYYESLMTQQRINDKLWNKIMNYIEENFREVSNVEERIANILRSCTEEEKEELLKVVKENNEELFGKLSNIMFSFEEIITVKEDIVRKALIKFNKVDIVKASKAASPNVVNYLQHLFNEINFKSERENIGNIQIDEIVTIQSEMIDAINKINK